MLKKLLAIVAASVMMLSCFGGVAQAEYGYDYKGQITCKIASTDETSKTTRFGSDAGDSTTKKYLFWGGNGTGETADTYYYFFKDYTPVPAGGNDNRMRLSNANTHEYLFDPYCDLLNVDSIKAGGKNFYSTGTDLYARMPIANVSGTSRALSSTMTYQAKIKFETNFITTDFIVSTGVSGNYGNRTINGLRITNSGMITAGARYLSDNSSTTEIDVENVRQLSLGQEYTIGIVIRLIPTDTSNQYDFEKTIYLDGEQIYSVMSIMPVTASKTAFYGFDVDMRPWTVNTNFDHKGKLATTSQYAYASGAGKFPSESIKLNEYTIIPTVTSVSDVYVYAGDKYAQDVATITDSEKEFHITSNVRNNTNYVTVAADAGTATAAKAILATYNGDKLVNVKSADLTLSADAITETDIELTNAGATKKTLFIFDSLGNLKPLAADTELN